MRIKSNINVCKKCGLETCAVIDKDQIKKLNDMRNFDFPSTQDVLDLLFNVYKDSIKNKKK